jgi:hypothetical protein
MVEKVAMEEAYSNRGEMQVIWITNWSKSE